MCAIPPCFGEETLIGEGYRWRVQCDAELILDLKEVNVFKVVDAT